MALANTSSSAGVGGVAVGGFEVEGGRGAAVLMFGACWPGLKMGAAAQRLLSEAPACLLASPAPRLPACRPAGCGPLLLPLPAGLVL